MRERELSALTGIRFYAALAVYLSHVVMIPGMEKLSGDSLVFNAGVVGVSFFFVLSGFILTYNYGEIFRNGIPRSAYKTFLWGRLTKIYPVHLLTLLIMLPLQVLSPNLPLDWRAVPFHVLLLQCFLPFSEPTFYNYLNVPSWSISCEWFFYLLAPLAMYFALTNKRRWAPVILTAAYALGLGLYLAKSTSGFERLYFVSWFAPSRFVEFLAGVFLCRFYLSAAGEKLERLAGAAQLAGLALILAGALMRASAPWPLWGGLLYVPGSALLVFGLAKGKSFFVAHLSRPWLNRLGIASFSLYMVHGPILRYVKGVCMVMGWEVQSWAVFWMIVAVMFVVVQGAALLLCSWYELPIQKRLRSLVSLTPAPAHG